MQYLFSVCKNFGGGGKKETGGLKQETGAHQLDDSPISQDFSCKNKGEENSDRDFEGSACKAQGVSDQGQP